MVDAELLDCGPCSQIELLDGVPLGHVRHQYRTPNLSSLCIAMLDDLRWVACCNSFMGSWFVSVFGSGCLCVSDLRLYVFRNSVIGFGSFVIRCAWPDFLVVMYACFVAVTLCWCNAGFGKFWYRGLYSNVELYEWHVVIICLFCSC